MNFKWLYIGQYHGFLLTWLVFVVWQKNNIDLIFGINIASR